LWELNIAILLVPLHTLKRSWLLLSPGAQQSIDDAVYLHLETVVELDKLKTSEGCITNARSPETVAALEELVTKWCQQIEQVCECV